MNLSYFAFNSVLGKITADACRPAMLKVLAPEIQLIILAAISGDCVAVGI